MAYHSSVLCPIDFSTPSRAALRYATAIAERFRTGLTLLTVNDAVVAEAAEMQGGPGWMSEDCQRELHQFFDQTFEHRTPFPLDVETVVTTGHPASEILRVARERHCDLIVMSTHGLAGVRKRFFGATTERVLRDTGTPVLITPAVEPGPLYLEDLRRLVGRVLVPEDLSLASHHQVEVAGALASAIDVPLLVAHVIEPPRSPGPPSARLTVAESVRQARSQQALDDLRRAAAMTVRTEVVTALGDPAEEIARLARDRHVGLIVMGLHAPAPAGPRMGSVAYRVLCLSRTPVLALPPATTSPVARLTLPVVERRDVAFVGDAL